MVTNQGRMKMNEKENFEYAIIKIAADPDAAARNEIEPVEIYFENDAGERLKPSNPDDEDVDSWPLPIDAGIYAINGAIWYHGNPRICIWYDKKRI
jgi:hypothetical protein